MSMLYFKLYDPHGNIVGDFSSDFGLEFDLDGKRRPEHRCHLLFGQGPSGGVVSATGIILMDCHLLSIALQREAGKGLSALRSPEPC